MSTQASSFPPLPFSITHPQQNLRLLELPTDLLDLLTSDSKPATLQLKSGLPSTQDSSTGTKSKDEYIHLCTKDKVWAIRQVSTSNSVYITTPRSSSGHHSPPDPDAMALDEKPTTGPGMTAIAQPTSSLELTPLNITQADVEDAISSLIPTHPLPNSDEADSRPPPASQTHTISSLISNLPYPDHFILPTLRSLFVFETHSPTPTIRTVFIPSPHLLLQSYRHFHTTFLTSQPRGADLSTFDVLGLGEITSAIATDEGEVFACVVNAIMERFVQLDLEDGEDEEQLREGYSLEGPLKGEELSIWLGQLIVRCAGDSGIDEEKLVDEWTGLLPRAWAGCCDVSGLGDEYILQDGKVRWTSPQKLNVNSDENADAAKTGAAATGKRKWHEKFAKERNKN